MKKSINIHTIVDFVILSFFILNIAGAIPYASNFKSLFLFAFLLIVFLYRKRKADPSIFIVVSLWLIINLISYFVNRPFSPSLITVFSRAMHIIIAYLMLKDIGVSFFDKFFGYAYVLTLISLPLYTIDLLFPSIATRIAPFFSFMTIPEQIQAGGYYSFIYMHNGWAILDYRNSGFMWEPGAFSCILVFLIFYRFLKRGFTVDKKVIFLLIALITTFSTSGYLALFIIIVAFLLNNKILINKYKLIIPILILLATVGSYMFYNDSNFMKGKIQYYIVEGTNSNEWNFENHYQLNVSRFGIFLIALDNAIHHPIGDGIFLSRYIESKYGEVSGPSSLSQILIMWGWLGLFATLFLLFLFSKLYSASKLTSLLFMLSMAIVWFSNPLIIQYFIYIVLFYPIIYQKEALIIKHRNSLNKSIVI